MSQERLNNSPSNRENREESQRQSETQVSHKTRMQAGFETIEMMLHELQKNQVFLLEQNSNIAAELSQVESERNEQQKENTNLRTALENPEWQVGEALCLLIQNNEVIEKQTRAEIKTIQMHLCELRENQDLLLEQNSSITAELSKVESERDGQRKENTDLSQENADLRKDLENLECQMGEAQGLIIQNNEMIEKQSKKIVDKQKQIDDLYKDLEMRRQMVQYLKELVSMKQNENVLVDVNNVREECQIADEPLQLENLAPESEALETPVAKPVPDTHEEVQTSGSGHRGAKHLPKVGLGLATVGLVVPAVYWAFSKMFN